jgi:hypothetical protein
MKAAAFKSGKVRHLTREERVVLYAYLSMFTVQYQHSCRELLALSPQPFKT